MKEASLMRLSIKDAEYYAYHGVKAAEKKLGGKYQVDIDAWYDATKAIINDDVKDALNYEEMMFCISEVMNYDSYSLIETIANEILNMIMEKFPALVKLTVRVRKFTVPMRQIIKFVEVEQTLTRKNPA
ncbi:MAG: 7,8-dihydroneopterin aldolase/epimerase/oxygenase [Bacteroidota bacterium]|nr:7,8-dihydroneopterin aldolase/epimerase/oxygenase [Bacteroidota bacterium]